MVTFSLPGVWMFWLLEKRIQKNGADQDMPSKPYMCWVSALPFFNMTLPGS